MVARHSSGNALSRYFTHLRDSRVLTREEETRLIRDVRNGRRNALDELIESNLGFVVKVANEYRGLGLPFEDLLNEGNIGLIEAARRFDPDRKLRFTTYAAWWIRKLILSAIATHASIVRVPIYQLRRVWELNDTETNLRNKLGRRPEREEISARLSQTPARVDALRQIRRRGVSLDVKVGRNKDLPLVALLEDVDSPSAEEIVIRKETQRHLVKALALLSRRERFVMTRRYGLDGEPAVTLKVLGRRMGVSRERVRQIEVGATHRIRRYFSRQKLMRAPGAAPRPQEKASGSRRDSPRHR